MVKNCYETTEVISLVNKETLPTDFWLDFLFPSANTRITNADKIVVGRYTSGQACMAPYTDPCGPGVALKRPDTAGDLSEFAPPTIKLKETVTVCDADERRIDPKTGNFISSYRTRMDMEVAEKGAIMRNGIIERLRFTAAQIAHNGGYTIEGDDVKTKLIDFYRDPKLMLDLVAGAGDTWNLNTTDPEDLFEAVTEVMLCYGVGGIFDVIYSPTAWAWKKKHIELNRREFNYGSSFDPVQDTGTTAFNYVTSKGTDGQFRHRVAVQKYKDSEGVMQDMIPDGSIVIVQREAFQGRRVYGGIKRANGDIIGQPIFFRDHIDQECDVRKLHAHSRPMLIPGNVNASACIQVVDPALPVTDL